MIILPAFTGVKLIGGGRQSTESILNKRQGLYG